MMQNGTEESQREKKQKLEREEIMIRIPLNKKTVTYFFIS